MATVIAVANQKGGVGKTTTTANLGAALALRGRRVLLVDLDPQGNLTSAFGLEKDIQQTVADELMVASAIYDHSARLRSYGLLDRIVESQAQPIPASPSISN